MEKTSVGMTNKTLQLSKVVYTLSKDNPGLLAKRLETESVVLTECLVTSSLG